MLFLPVPGLLCWTSTSSGGTKTEKWRGKYIHR